MAEAHTTVKHELSPLPALVNVQADKILGNLSSWNLLFLPQPWQQVLEGRDLIQTTQTSAQNMAWLSYLSWCWGFLAMSTKLIWKLYSREKKKAEAPLNSCSYLASVNNLQTCSCAICTYAVICGLQKPFYPDMWGTHNAVRWFTLWATSSWYSLLYMRLTWNMNFLLI